MADIYVFKIFLECHTSAPLGEQQIRAAERYFRLRRKSGGGDCGTLTRVFGQIYRIAFRNQKDQQRVLLRPDHIVELPDGRLMFTVRGTLEPDQSSSSHSLPTPAQSLLPNPGSISQPSVEEYELCPQAYLLRYLLDCGQAKRELEQELLSLTSFLHLYPDRVLVRRSTLSGSEVEGSIWKAEVDKLFDRYRCHFEPDQHKVRCLHQFCRHQQIPDDVKVYHENSMAVVVGKCVQVDAFLSSLKFQLTHLGKKQTITRRLGEAKLRLLWKEIEQGLRQIFPGVTFTRESAGQLVLEGPLKDIDEACDWISHKEKRVSERTVSNMSPNLLSFLRKTYVLPGTLSDFLGVGDEVEIELRETQLKIFSCSVDKLNDSETALQGRFKETQIPLPYSLDLLTELQKRLQIRISEMNQVQYKAQFRFGSDSTVYLLGHTGEVDVLIETVTEFRNNISASLKQGEMNTIVSRYIIHDGLEVVVCQGDIAKQEADVLVNAANEDLDHSKGAAAALSREGGPDIQRECHDIVRCVGNISVGTVVVTTGGNLRCKSLLHAVGPRAGAGAGSHERFLLEQTVHSALNMAEQMEMSSIAMPFSISEMSGLPLATCSEVIVTAVKEFGRWGGRSLRKIILIDNREEVVSAMLETCDWLFQRSGSSFGSSMEIDTDFKVTARGATAGSFEDSEVLPETLKSKQISQRLSKDIPQPEEVSTPIKIFLLGKTGTGKSTLANTIFGEEGLFPTSPTFSSVTSRCQAETRSVNGRSITLIDTPGFFDTNNHGEEIRSQLINGIVECAPGPHAFLIVLKVERFTQQEQEVINEIHQIFSEDALQFAVLVFTHGDQLPKGVNFQKLINENKNLSDLVGKCGGRYHIFDNKPGKNKEHGTGSSRQVEELMNTIDEMVISNNGGVYTNERLYQLREDIIKQEMSLIKSSPHMPRGEITKLAKKKVSNRILIQLSGIATGALVGAFFGLALYTGLDVTAINNISALYKLKGAAMNAVKIINNRGMELAALGIVTAAGGIAGGAIGHEVAKTANTPEEAMWSAARAVWNSGQQLQPK